MTRTVGPGPGVGVFAQHPRHDKVLLLLVAVNLITLQVVVVGHVQSGREREREEIENQCSAINTQRSIVSNNFSDILSLSSSVARKDF